MMARRLLSLQRLAKRATTISPIPPPPPPPPPRSGVLCKVIDQRPAYWFSMRTKGIHLIRYCNIHTSPQLSSTNQSVLEPQNNNENTVTIDANSTTKVKRKKLVGKRAVVRWVKHFRWKKKKEYERMTAEERILYKLRKAQKKEVRIVESLKKIEPLDSAEATHDPEILTPEEHFYFLKMGHKCKNYVPVGRRGIFQGVILNMHLHWKKHQTLKVVVKTFTPEEVREIAAELARLSGGIVLEIHEDNTIIMYRGKNYSQPPTEIMSPRVSLSRKKALDKSKYKDSLRALRRYIPRLHQDLEDLQVQMQRDGEKKVKDVSQEETTDTGHSKIISLDLSDKFDELEGTRSRSSVLDKDVEDPNMRPVTLSESEDLSDIFETDSDADPKEQMQRPLYMDQIEMFPTDDDGESEDLEGHLHQISASQKGGGSSRKDEALELDEIDKIFLRAGSLLKKKRR